jgi:signal transduction histidine kinase
VLAGSLFVGIGAAVPALFLIPRHPSASDLGAYAAITAGLIFVTAGGARLVVWKIVGRAIFGWMGAAFVVLGVLIAVCDGLTTFSVVRVPVVGPVGSLVTAALAGWMVRTALADEEVNAGLRPMMFLVYTLVGGLGVVGILHAAQTNRLLPAWVGAGAVGAGFNLASALIWVAVTTVVLRAVRRKRSGVPPWTGLLVALLALAAAIRALSPLPWASTLAASACLFSAAALALGTSIQQIQRTLTWRDGAQRHLQLTLTATMYQAARDRRALEMWLHDLRNAVAGLEAADSVLWAGLRSGAGAEPELADAVTAELARLHAMIDPARQLRIGDVDLATVVHPVVAAERARGTSIEVQLDARSVLADGDALGRVLQNLLTNARVHAPGSPVRIDAARHGQMVELVIADAGPGIGLAERSAVFERGARGKASVGSDGNGLGLYVVRTLMTAMGGGVKIAESDTGCRVVLNLRTAAPTADPGRGPMAPRRHLRIGAPSMSAPPPGR